MDNFDLRKYLAEGRLFKENTGKTISYIQDGDNQVLFLPPGEYPLIVSGFYGGGSYRSFRKQPVSTLTVKGNGLELPVNRGNLVWKKTPPVTHPNQLPDGYSPYVDAFREKVKKRRISDETGLHVDLRDFDFNEVDNFDNIAEGRLLKEAVNNKYVVKNEELSDEDGDFYVIDTNKASDYLSQFNVHLLGKADQFIKDDEGLGQLEASLEGVEEMSDEELEDAMREEMSYYFFGNPDSLNNLDSPNTSNSSQKEYSTDFPEMEDEFEGAMLASTQSKESYLRDIADIPYYEIDLDGYYEVKNAIEQGVYTEEEAMKLMKKWAKEKLNNLFK